ncbi:MAG: hypothetical protein ABEN55_18090, partial [Bradymonadaceae bacterium]
MFLEFPDLLSHFGDLQAWQTFLEGAESLTFLFELSVPLGLLFERLEFVASRLEFLLGLFELHPLSLGFAKPFLPLLENLLSPDNIVDPPEKLGPVVLAEAGDFALRLSEQLAIFSADPDPFQPISVVRPTVEPPRLGPGDELVTTHP